VYERRVSKVRLARVFPTGTMKMGLFVVLKPIPADWGSHRGIFKDLVVWAIPRRRMAQNVWGPLA